MQLIEQDTLVTHENVEEEIKYLVFMYKFSFI